LLGKEIISPIPVVDELPDETFSIKSNYHIDWNDKGQLDLLSTLENFTKEFSEILEKVLY